MRLVLGVVGVFRLPLRLGGFDPVEQLCFLMRRLSEAREDGDVSPRCARPMSCFGPVRVFRTGQTLARRAFMDFSPLAAGEDPLGLKPNVAALERASPPS